MAWTISDNDVFYGRLQNMARQHLDSYEEGARLISLAQSEDLGTNLEDHSGDMATKAEAIAMKGVIDDFKAFVDGDAVPADADRRAKLDVFLARIE